MTTKNDRRDRIIMRDLSGVPPRHEAELEAAVIAEALYEPASAESVLGLGLTAEDMYVNEHAVLVTAMLRLREAGQPVTLHTLRRDLEAQPLEQKDAPGPANEWELVGQLSGLNRLRMHPPVGDLTRAVADLRALAQQRRTGEVAAMLAADARTFRGPPSEFVAAARATLEGRVDESGGVVEGVEMCDAVAQAVEHIGRVRRGESTPRGIAIPGLSTLSSMLGGLRLGRMRVVGADTGGGKTTLALQEAIAVAGTWHNGERVGVVVVSGEMSAQELALRALQCEGSLTEDELFDSEGNQLNAFSRSTVQALADAEKALAEKPIIIVDASLSLEGIQGQVRRAGRRWKAPTRPMVVVVDYLGIMDLGSARVDRHERIGTFTRGLKKLSRAENLHVTLLAQFNRAGKKSTSEATIADFDGSGAIENDADQIVILDRPNLRLPTDQQLRELDDYARVRLAKSRVGKTSARAVAWDGARFRLLDPMDEQRQRWKAAQDTLAERTATKDRRQQW